MADPLEFARAHVRARSLCSEMVVAWLAAHGIDAGLSRRAQLKAWRDQGALEAATAIGARLGLEEIPLAAARDGDVAVAIAPTGQAALGLMRAARFVATASGAIVICDGGILKTWRIPCLS